MSATRAAKARLTALRLVGFKSFAERTVIEFGPGISAVVGPNGSGKSNLADALRWTLGEQGRSLRTRRAEDVIFAGSSSRKAIGMADVTLVIDNDDRLLPVDFGEVEISRRLYRSGENEYMLNRQRLRLRDLVEMLDAGNLADNAFLFIGQGMVDQALALRPEERRPLFEEAAGVRRHERRRRQAEAELAEAETNLERLRDLLGELRPQARRLAAQAEQLEARRTAGLELAEALLEAAHSRWGAAEETERRESAALSKARTAADTALADLHAAEDVAERTSHDMASHADLERQRRAAVDDLRSQIGELRVTAARLGSDISALDRDRERLSRERDALAARLRDARLAASAATPQPDPTLAAELDAVERSLDELRSAARADVDAESAAAAVARALAKRRTEHDEHERRAAAATAAAETADQQLKRLSRRLAEAEDERDSALSELESITKIDSDARAELESARDAARTTADSLASTTAAARDVEVELAAVRASLSALEAALESSADDGLARAARARGGNLVADGLEVEARFRAAVSAALDRAAGAFAVDDAAPLVARGRRGALVIRGASRRPSVRTEAFTASAVVRAAQEHGGGDLAEAIRRDAQGEVTRLLERIVWLPDLATALKLRPALPDGWRAVSLQGDTVTDEGVVVFASEASVLQQQSERDSLGRRASELEARLVEANREVARAREAADVATTAVASAQRRADETRSSYRSAEERERLAQRRAEQWLREVTWEQSRVERLQAEAASAAELAKRSGADLAGLAASGDIRHEQSSTKIRGSELADLESRRATLSRARAQEEARLTAWREERGAAEVKRGIDEARLVELDDALAQLIPRRAKLASEESDVASRLATAEAAESEATRQLETVLAAGVDDRQRLIDAERRAAEARERLRVAEQQSRRSEVAQMEARLQLEQIREGLLVELAGIGSDGLIALAEAARRPLPIANESETETDAFESGLDAVVSAWRDRKTDAPEPLTTSRLATLRRRFHDLGAGNPFAAEEYAELRERLDGMEAQREDLESAISSTRELIASLNALITEQFRRTFAALEDAFARRFHELFGGGDAELSLTLPDDLTSTGVEIHARPPGKKRQPLSMLSGGERALTAVSLLLAMLEVRPVPFCVLDEVDAALDEANIGRFSKALRGLAEQTQFIVITHNRGTIEGADALYGVTLGDDAVSRVISLRLPKPGSNGNAPHELVDESTEAEAVEPSEAALA